MTMMSSELPLPQKNGEGGSAPSPGDLNAHSVVGCDRDGAANLRRAKAQRALKPVLPASGDDPVPESHPHAQGA